MAYELNNNSGNLFENKFKKNDRHPDYRGSIKINDKEWEISAWEKRNKNNEIFYGLSIQEPYKKESTIKDDHSGEDIPF